MILTGIRKFASSVSKVSVESKVFAERWTVNAKIDAMRQREREIAARMAGEADGS